MLTAPFIVLAAFLSTVVEGGPEPAGPAGQPESVLERVWSMPLARLRGTTLVRAEPLGEMLLVEDARHGLSAVDPLTGRLAWFVQLEGPLAHWPTLGAGHVALVAGTVVVVVDATSGARVMRWEGAEPAAEAAAADAEALYLPTLLGDRLLSIGTARGVKAWELLLSSQPVGPAQRFGSTAMPSVLLPTADGMLRCVPAGVAVPAAERWTSRVGVPVGRIAVEDARIVLASRERSLVVLDPASGEVVARHMPGEAWTSGPVVSGGAAFAATGSRLIAVDLATGAQIWERAGLAPVGTLGGALVASGDGELLVLLSARDGHVIEAGLPRSLRVAGGIGIELAGGGTLVGWRLRPAVRAALQK